MIKEQAEQAINEIDLTKIEGYKEYWNSIAPKTEREYFLRWVFSFLSVHTTWTSNVNAFNLLSQTDVWWTNHTALGDYLKVSKVGLYNRRLKGISKFSDDFWTDPSDWKKNDNETWIQCRDRLQEKCYGLGLAKTAFALEMCYPNENESVCLDTHMLQLYGYSTENEKHKGAQYKNYAEMEAHWAEQCRLKGLPAYIGRALFWDKKQNKEDSRYWSYVFENEKITS